MSLGSLLSWFWITSASLAHGACVYCLMELLWEANKCLMWMSGTSSADDAMAVSSAQLQVHKLMQDFALPRPGLMSGMLAPPGGALLPLSSHGGPGPNEQLALVPVMIQNPDGTFTGAYQVQPYPSGFSTDGGPLEMTGDFLLMLAASFVQVFTPACEVSQSQVTQAI